QALVREGERLRQHPAFAGLRELDEGSVDLAVQGGVGVDYQQAFIYHRSFARDQVPSVEALNELLEMLLAQYQEYVDSQASQAAETMTLPELLTALHRQVTAAGFRYP